MSSTKREMLLQDRDTLINKMRQARHTALSDYDAHNKLAQEAWEWKEKLDEMLKSMGAIGDG